MVRRLSLNELIPFSSLATLIRREAFLSIHLDVIDVDDVILRVIHQ
jgi:hypothetical protein